MKEKGKTKGDRDTLIFKDGKFRSTACDVYGFSEAAEVTLGRRSGPDIGALFSTGC